MEGPKTSTLLNIEKLREEHPEMADLLQKAYKEQWLTRKVLAAIRSLLEIHYAGYGVTGEDLEIAGYALQDYDEEATES
jgi:hypothetical protein